MPSLHRKIKWLVESGTKEDLAALPNRLKTDSGYAGFNAKSKPEDVLNHIHSHDPSGGSYKPWLTKTYLNGGIRHLEDLPRAKIALKLFHNNKSKLEYKDINHYKSLPELEKAIKPLINLVKPLKPIGVRKVNNL